MEIESMIDELREEKEGRFRLERENSETNEDFLPNSGVPPTRKAR